MISDQYYQFVHRLTEQLITDTNFVALAAGGSWIEGQMDKFSDIDLIVVHQSEHLPNAKKKQVAQAAGDLLVSFTGEHVGEPRLLICLYDSPLLHVDLKFARLSSMTTRVEEPVVLWERDQQLTSVLVSSEAHFPYPDYQWIEDRFWVWVHYAATKIGRGEIFETLTFLSFLQQNVLGPLALIKQGDLPKGVRKLEMRLPSSDLQAMRQTVSGYEKQASLQSLRNVVTYYRSLREMIMPDTIAFRTRAEARVMTYLDELE